MKTNVHVEGRDEPIVVRAPAHIAADSKRVRALWHDAAYAGVMATLEALHPNGLEVHEMTSATELDQGEPPFTVGFSA